MVENKSKAHKSSRARVGKQKPVNSSSGLKRLRRSPRHTRFRFLELPGELRNQIYEYVIYNGPPRSLDMIAEERRVEWSKSTLEKLHRNHSLLCVSGQVSNEYRDVVEKHGEFKFHLPGILSPLREIRIRSHKDLSILKTMHKCRINVGGPFYFHDPEPHILKPVWKFIGVLEVANDICISWYYHCSNRDETQWEDFAKNLMQKLKETKPLKLKLLKRLKVIVMDKRKVQRVETVFPEPEEVAEADEGVSRQPAE